MTTRNRISRALGIVVWLRSGIESPRPAPSGAERHRTGVNLLAAGGLALIFPALLFLAAVVVRYVPPMAEPAQRVVMWYATRTWTLWVLLIALPLAALITGGVKLLWNVGASNSRPALLVATAGPARLIVVETVTAGMILTVVILHMLAN
jgi:hypothetical protein